jgi:hydrogenase maturation protease
MVKAATQKPDSTTLVLGLGNPILGDDGVGLFVAREAGLMLCGHPEITVAEAMAEGFDLMDILAGYARVIIIDAAKTEGGRPGQVHVLRPEDLPASRRLTSGHEISLVTALALGRTLGVLMPEDVTIVAIEVVDDQTFGEGCSPEVAAAIQESAAAIVNDVLGRRPLAGRAESAVAAPGS